MTLFKTVLVTVLVLGALVNVLAAGTSASYLASTTPATVSFDTGAFALSNRTSLSSTTCWSTGGAGPRTIDGDNHQTCDSLFQLPHQKPGATASVDLTLRNEGDTSAAKLHLFANPRCATTASPAPGYHGSGDLCPRLQLTISEDASGFTYSSSLEHLGTNHSTAALELPGGLAAGSARHLRVRIQLPATATDQSLQGRAATFGFTWQLTH